MIRNIVSFQTKNQTKNLYFSASFYAFWNNKTGVKFRGDSHKMKNRKNSGQVTAEYLLLAVVLLFLFGLVTKTLRNNDHLKSFQEKPNKLFKSMVENGNWEADKGLSQKHHPNQHNLHYTPNATQ